MTYLRIQNVFLASLLCFTVAHRAANCCAQRPLSNAVQNVTIDAQTRWAFRTLSPVTVSSPIIRLGDVVQPLDPNMAGWQRLRKSPIGLVPIGGQPMSIQRDRLGQAIHDAEATPLAIDWIGPKTIKVIYRESERLPSAHPAQSHSMDAGVVAANYGQAPSNAGANQRFDASGKPLVQSASNQAMQPPGISATEADRVIHWIKLAIERQHSTVAENYRIEIDRRQTGLIPLRSISGVTTIEPRDTVGEGGRRFHVIARSIYGQVESDVEATLEAHPQVVVPRKTLARGHRIEATDLTMKAIPEKDLAADYVVDPEPLVGLEVRGSVRANRPIHQGDVGSPTLVHRGDLVEIRVVGGGITVTTNAKSMSDGAASDLIEVETLQPRRRLVARVVQPGLVEIVSRAPRVKP